MTNDYDINDLAAEYVLGTLDADERADVEVRRAVEPLLAHAIEVTEHAMAPLAAAGADVAPPAAIRAKLLATVAQSAAAVTPVRQEQIEPGIIKPDFAKLRPADVFGRSIEDPATALTTARGEIVELRGRLNRWRGMTAAVTTMAASLAGLVVYRDAIQKVQPPAPQTFVAVLQKNDQSPAFLMTVDVGKRIFTVRPVAAKQPPGKSYELWIIHDKLGAPKSLGILADNAPRAGVSLAAYDPAAISGAKYAVTVEPEGGSPTGAPTSAPVFIGTLIPAGLQTK